jgi:hypothetical protein
MRVYHRYQIEGFEQLERPGAALLVGYHGRPLAFDQCMLTVTIFERLGYLPHGVINDVLASRPRLKRWVDQLGFVTGDGPRIAEAVARGEHVMVQPGGVREAARSWRAKYRVEWGNRRGYLKLALRHRLPIIPLAADGVDDAFVGVNDGYALSTRLGLPKQLPLWLGFGIGGPWPLAAPLPVQITQRIGAPIDPAAEGVVDERDADGLTRLHAKVSGAVQALLDRGRRAR